MIKAFSNLGLNLQATGENSGTWGAITNVNLQEIDNIATNEVGESVSGFSVGGGTESVFDPNFGGELLSVDQVDTYLESCLCISNTFINMYLITPPKRKPPLESGG